MEQWIAKFKAVSCQYDHDGERRNIIVIDVDGTAIPSAGISEFGTVEELRVPTGQRPKRRKPPAKRAVLTAMKKARALAEHDLEAAALDAVEGRDEQVVAIRSWL